MQASMALHESIKLISESLLELSQYWLGKFGTLPPVGAVANHLETHFTGILCSDEKYVVSNLHELMSPREQQVLDGLFEQLSNKEIAAQLHISERTVKFHVSNLLAKFNVSTRAALLCLVCSMRKTVPKDDLLSEPTDSRGDAPAKHSPIGTPSSLQPDPTVRHLQ